MNNLFFPPLTTNLNLPSVNHKRTSNPMFQILYSNFVSTKPNNKVNVCATRLYHENDDEADNQRDYRKKCVGNQQKQKDDQNQDQDDEQDDLLEQTRALQKWA